MNTEELLRHTDIYFRRAKQTLLAKDLNPWVNIQVFIRKGPGILDGINHVVWGLEGILPEDSRIYSLRDNDHYEPGETVMNIIAPAQSIIEWETIYLGILSQHVTANNGVYPRDSDILEAMKRVKEAVGDRMVMYFGARHTHPDNNIHMSELALKAGLDGAATEAGAEVMGVKPSGTIPHALEAILSEHYGEEDIVAETVAAFHETMPEDIPRIALVDYYNRETWDTYRCLVRLGANLDGIRIDTCGENIMEGGAYGIQKYHDGTGVTTRGVMAVRDLLDKYPDFSQKIYLSSGFSDYRKVEAFNQVEKETGKRLYDGIGAGFLDGMWTATADIVAVADDPDRIDFMSGPVKWSYIHHKVGRPPKPNPRLERRI